MRKFWQAGYDLFCPNMDICRHMWSRKYRPTFGQDHAEASRMEHQEKCTKALMESLVEDKGFVDEMSKRGIDLVGKKIVPHIAENGGLDKSYFL